MDPSRTRKPVSWGLGAVFIKVAMRRSGEGLTERLRDRSPARRLGSFLGLSRPRHHVGSKYSLSVRQSSYCHSNSGIRLPRVLSPWGPRLTGTPGHIYRSRRRTAESRLYYNEYSERTTSVLGAVRHRRTEVNLCHLATALPILLLGLLYLPGLPVAI
jgi:hypothetical protein